MATGREAWVNDSSGHPQKVKAIWVNDSSGHPQKVKAAWANHSDGTTHQWWPPHGGGTHPPAGGHTTKTITLAGRRTGDTWTFSVGPYAGKVTHATLLVTSGVNHMHGILTVRPHGLVHLDQNPQTTTAHTVGTSTTSVTGGGTFLGGLPTRISLRITYRT